MTGFPQRDLLTGSQVWTGDPVQDAMASQAGFDQLSLLLNQLKRRIAAIGEYDISEVSGVGSWVDNTVQDVTSLELEAGEWDVEGGLTFVAGALTGTGVVASISLTSGAEDLSAGENGRFDSPTIPSATFGQTYPTGTRRISLIEATTVYLTGRMAFTVGSPSASGWLRATRADWTFT